MDIYEFSERDDQTDINNQTRHKTKRRRNRTSENFQKRKRGRKAKSELNDIVITDKNPPIRLKLIRDSSDPKSFKSIPLFANKSNEAPAFDVNKKSVLKFKLTDGKDFRINELVWAKITGFPYWPAKILNATVPIEGTPSVNEMAFSAEDVTVSIEWISYDQMSYINCANITHFLQDYDKKFNPQIKNNKYHEAVNEAKQLAEEEEKVCENRIGSSNSVHSCETSFEADTSSSTLPSHNFTSPESNQSIQSSSYHNPKPNVVSDPSSNQSSICCNLDYTNFQTDTSTLSTAPLSTTTFVTTNYLHSAQKPASTADFSLLHTVEDPSDKFPNNISWELPDLGSNLFLEDNNHIPEFSESEDDEQQQPIFDIKKIDSLIDIDHV